MSPIWKQLPNTHIARNPQHFNFLKEILMARFLLINNKLRQAGPHEEYTDGDIYIDLEKIIYVHLYINLSDEQVLKIQLLDNEKFEFKYDETDPVWKPLFSWLNK